jgi:hypothetical protein
MKRVSIETDDGTRYSVDVDEPSPVKKMQIAAGAPDELVENDLDLENVESVEDLDVDFEVTEDLVDYLVDVATRVTELEESDLNRLQLRYQTELCAEILNAIFEDDPTDPTNRCVKRVRMTEEVFEHLFKGEMTMVAGMPDDASFEDFNYDPSRMEFQFIFSSDEWEPIPEGAAIPVFDVTCVEIPSTVERV